MAIAQTNDWAGASGQCALDDTLLCDGPSGVFGAQVGYSLVFTEFVGGLFVDIHMRPAAEGSDPLGNRASADAKKAADHEGSGKIDRG